MRGLPNILPGLLACVLFTHPANAADEGQTDPSRTQSPIAYFRQLLVMTDSQRSEELSERPAKQRAGLEAKIAEYSAMPATERELRLRATELRYYLLPMMQLPAEERQARLDAVPEDIRDLVEDRLTQWILIPPTLQQQLLENQATLQLFSRMHPDVAATADELVDDLQMASVIQRQEDYQRWRSLSEGERSQLMRSFNHFFQLTAMEKKRTLRTLSPEERQAMTATLEKFEALPPAHREACVRGAQQFLMLPPSERVKFLENVDRWRTMSPEAREEWRTVVNQLSMIPLPPDVDPVLVVDTPPLPIGASPPDGSLTN